MTAFRSWDDVAAYALSLPGTEVSTSWGAPTIRVRGKAFLYPGREAGSFAVAARHDDKEILIETDPATFWQTDHYRNWPGLLVRFDSPDRERIERVITRAWWDRLDKGGRARFGPRP